MDELRVHGLPSTNRVPLPPLANVVKVALGVRLRQTIGKNVLHALLQVVGMPGFVRNALALAGFTHVTSSQANISFEADGYAAAQLQR